MADRPNILVILSDQHGAKFTGADGHPVVQSPHIDRLAEEGVLFANAYTNCPLCVPSRMSFLTGRRVQNIGVWDNHTILPSSSPTWPRILSEAGYDVVLNGKMHFRGPDQLHGFDRQISFDPTGRLDTQNDHSAPIPNWKEGATIRGVHHRLKPAVGKPNPVDDAVAPAAIRYLKERAGKSQPWAMVASFYAPHPPWRVEQTYLDGYSFEDIVSLGGVTDSMTLDGSDFMKLARDEDPDWKDEALVELYGTWVDRPLAALRRGPYKLVKSLNEEPELYDLVEDPDELHDRSAHAEWSEIKRELERRLFEQWDPVKLNEDVRRSQAERRR